jgi:hypothetical protein
MNKNLYNCVDFGPINTVTSVEAARENLVFIHEGTLAVS